MKKKGKKEDSKQTEFKFTFGSPLLRDVQAEEWSDEKMILVAELYESSAHQLRKVAEIRRYRKEMARARPERVQRAFAGRYRLKTNWLELA